MDFRVPRVMGILNSTPDSFYTGSRHFGDVDLKTAVERLIAEGADIIDVGGCSTRPGSVAPSQKEEIERIDRALSIVRQLAPKAVVSLDTWRSEVAYHAITKWGIAIINDISGGRFDNNLFDVVAETHVVYVLTHSRSIPAEMMRHAGYEDVTVDVIKELSETLWILRSKNINDIIIDPGFGFAKTPQQSLALLNELEEFCRLGLPVLAGLSRKSLIWKTLGTTPEESLAGTVALNAVAIEKGADILRVHDVREAKETITLLSKMRNYND